MKPRQLELLPEPENELSPRPKDSEGLLHLENSLWRAGRRQVAGVDEVGVGPLAGPVVSAAVILPPGTHIRGVADSKLLSPQARARLRIEIQKAAVQVGVGVASVEEIDALNIYHAALLAMRRAVEALGEPPDHLLVDARIIPGVTIPQTSVTKGDRRSLSIASASIVAKTYRDALMTDLARKYPGYGFAKHKGYPTRDHQEAIQSLGPSPVHRRSFAFLEELTGAFSELFYSLRSSISTASDPAGLSEGISRYRSSKGMLSVSERRKLTLLIRRRRNTLGCLEPTITGKLPSTNDS